MHTWDSRVPVEETLRTLDTLVHSGKVRYIGCSNFCAWQLMKSLAASDRLGLERYVGQQMQYSLVAREIEHGELPVALDQSVGTLVWSPLAQGYLTGKYRDAHPDGRLAKSGNVAGIDGERAWATVDILVDIAAARDGATPGQIAIAWLLRRPGVTSVLVGPRTDTQLADNLAAASIRLSDEEMSRLNAVSAPAVPYPLSHQSRFQARNPRLPEFSRYETGSQANKA